MLLEFIKKAEVSFLLLYLEKGFKLLFPSCCQRLVCLKVTSLETGAGRVLDVTFLQVQSLIQLFQSGEGFLCLCKRGIVHTKIMFKNTHLPPSTPVTHNIACYGKWKVFKMKLIFAQCTTLFDFLIPFGVGQTHFSFSAASLSCSSLWDHWKQVRRVSGKI